MPFGLTSLSMTVTERNWRDEGQRKLPLDCDKPVVLSVGATFKAMIPNG
jgi:hypothetical protein